MVKTALWTRHSRLTVGDVLRKSRAVSLLISGLVVLAAVSPADAAFSGINGRIAFQNSNAGQIDIYSIKSDGTDLVRLTNDPGEDERPAWSPDGARIAFSSNRDGNREIYVMDHDGSNETRITFNTESDRAPSWSPDGSKIIYGGGGVAADGIKIINADGSGPVTTIPNTDAGGQPVWSPDGATVAYQRSESDEELYRINVDGTGRIRLTNNAINDAVPDWSPSGAKLVFYTDRDAASCSQPCWRIYSMNPDGTAQTRLTVNSSLDYIDPAWSPDGTKIVFSRGNTGEISVMNADGSSQVVFSLSGSDTRPDWQPIYVPRPKGATPSRFSLVPAYSACTSANREHGPPLSSASCNPPAQVSSNLTVGTADANGASAGSIGFLRLVVLAGVPAGDDDTDVAITLGITDVRCQPGVLTCGSANSAGGADYTGEVQVRIAARITDKYNAVAPGGGTDAASGDMTLQVTAPCGTAPTPSTVGSTCEITTTADAVYGNLSTAKEGTRAMWALSDARVDDGGPDGDAETAGDNTLFARQGIFVP